MLAQTISNGPMTRRAGPTVELPVEYGRPPCLCPATSRHVPPCPAMPNLSSPHRRGDRAARNHDATVKRTPRVTAVTSWVVSEGKASSIPASGTTVVRSGYGP
jgi:hypothetical protein